MTKSTIWFSVAAFLAASAAGQAASINLVTNGSFEQGTLGIGSFESWNTTLGDATTYVDSTGQTGAHYGQASDGLWSAYFGSTAADGGASISQTLATTANTVYVLTFDLANDTGGLAPSNAFSASVGGVTVFSSSNLSNQDYIHEQFMFTASGNATSLAFAGFNDQSFLELDNVAVTATPEPSTITLLMAAVLSSGLIRRRQIRSR